MLHHNIVILLYSENKQVAVIYIKWGLAVSVFPTSPYTRLGFWYCFSPNDLRNHLFQSFSQWQSQAVCPQCPVGAVLWSLCCDKSSSPLGCTLSRVSFLMVTLTAQQGNVGTSNVETKMPLNWRATHIFFKNISSAIIENNNHDIWLQHLIFMCFYNISLFCVLRASCPLQGIIWFRKLPWFCTVIYLDPIAYSKQKELWSQLKVAVYFKGWLQNLGKSKNF